MSYFSPISYDGKKVKGKSEAQRGRQEKISPNAESYCLPSLLRESRQSTNQTIKDEGRRGDTQPSNAEHSLV